MLSPLVGPPALPTGALQILSDENKADEKHLLDEVETDDLAAELASRRATARRRRPADSGAAGRFHPGMYRGSVPGPRTNKKRDFPAGVSITS